MFQRITDNPVKSTWIFYDTHFSRSDVLKLIGLEKDPEKFRKYILDNILVNWKQKEASENRNEVFLDQLCQIYRFMDKQQYSAEQKSCMFSLTFEVFIKSMEKKMTQLDSFYLLKEALVEQTKIFSCGSVPLFSLSQVNSFAEFLKGSFYRQYSQYEITMTKFIDLNIYSNSTVPPSLPETISLSSGSRIMNPAELPALKYIFDKIAENPDIEDDEEEQIEAQLRAEKERQEALIREAERVAEAEAAALAAKRILSQEDELVQQYINKKLDTYSQQVDAQIHQASNQAIEQAQNIINPPKKK